MRRDRIVCCSIPIRCARTAEVLAEMKSDPERKRIPVVALATSQAEEDVVRVYDLHASCYVTKPVDFEQFMRVVRQTDDFRVCDPAGEMIP
jgi:response regulator RpfG family c-di-GMP phosphodiesterase